MKDVCITKSFSPARGTTVVLTWNQKTGGGGEYRVTMETTAPKIKTAFKAVTGLWWEKANHYVQTVPGPRVD